MNKIVVMLLLLYSFSLSAGEVTLPPDSLGAWYKPANKRQVWLHNMFKLRRELQAVREYRVLEDQPRLEKWAKRLVEHYLKIGEMVPEWQDELEREVAESLKQAASKGDFQQVARSVRKLGLSCRSCHRDYRAVAAARYRSPDYSRITVENSETLETEPLKDAMKRLSQLVNRVKIAAEDDRMPVAEEALAGLRQHLEDLGGSCKQCHSDPAPRLRILGDDTRASIDLIGQGIAREDKTLIGRNLGELAVGACARCHSVHRTLSDLKSVMMSSGVP